MHRLGPGVGAREPRVRWRISGATQKRDHHHIVHGLAVRQIRMDPQPVPSLQVRHFRDGQSLAVTLNANVNLWPDQVECGTIGVREDAPGEDQYETRKKTSGVQRNQEAHYTLVW